MLERQVQSGTVRGKLPCVFPLDVERRASGGHLCGQGGALGWKKSWLQECSQGAGPLCDMFEKHIRFSLTGPGLEMGAMHGAAIIDQVLIILGRG